jgi:hypothetical protein
MYIFFISPCMLHVASFSSYLFYDLNNAGLLRMLSVTFLQSIIILLVTFYEKMLISVFLSNFVVLIDNILHPSETIDNTVRSESRCALVKAVL